MRMSARVPRTSTAPRKRDASTQCNTGPSTTPMISRTMRSGTCVSPESQLAITAIKSKAAIDPKMTVISMTALARDAGNGDVSGLKPEYTFHRDAHRTRTPAGSRWEGIFRFHDFLAESRSKEPAMLHYNEILRRRFRGYLSGDR